MEGIFIIDSNLKKNLYYYVNPGFLQAKQDVLCYLREPPQSGGKHLAGA